MSDGFRREVQELGRVRFREPFSRVIHKGVGHSLANTVMKTYGRIFMCTYYVHHLLYVVEAFYTYRNTYEGWSIGSC